MASKGKKFSLGKTILLCALALIVGFAAAFFLYSYIKRETGGDTYVSGDLSIHFMELGNEYAGDSIYIKAGDTDILIDAGSRASSTDTTAAYIDRYSNTSSPPMPTATTSPALRAAVLRRASSSATSARSSSTSPAPTAIQRPIRRT